jgi:hypothetical protein
MMAMATTMGARCLVGLLIVLVLMPGMVGCSADQPKVSAEINQQASVAGEFAAALPANPLQWKVITSEISKMDSTMSTLYGNDLAVQYARRHTQTGYPAGSVLSMVTWSQQEDPRWFGARIPAAVKSVEFVDIEATPDGRPSYSYQNFEGTPLKRLLDLSAQSSSERTAYLLSQRAALMP